MEKADLNGTKTCLTLEVGDEKTTIAVEGTSISVTEFMELVEMLLVNAKYEQKDIDNYILQWARDIRSSKQN